MNHMKRVIAVGALITAAAVALAGCSTSTSTSHAGKVKSTLSLAISGAPASLDYLGLDLNTDIYIWTALYDTLVWTDGAGKVHPGAAESYTYSAGNTVLTLKLRTGMKFSNGDPVTAADVKDDLTEFKAKGNYSSTLSSVDSVATPDSHTVVLHLSAPDPALLGSLSRNAGVVADPKTVGTAANKLDPVGSGPYTLDSAKTTAGSTYTLARNPNYWGVKQFPYKTVVVKVIADETATLNALKSGEIDNGSVDQTTYAQAKADGLKVGTTAGSAVWALMLFDRSGKILPPLGHLEVRQAINLALDRTAFVKSLLQGLGQPTDQVFQPSSAGYVASINNEYAYNVAKAKALMAKAGYASGFSVSLPDFGYISAFEPTIIQELGAIGITAKFVPTSFQQYETGLATGQYPMVFTPSGISAVQTDTSIFVAPDGSFNPFHTTNATIAGLLHKAQYSLTTPAQNAAYANITKYLVKNAWFAPIAYSSSAYATVKGVNFTTPTENIWFQLRNFSNNPFSN